MHSNVKNSSLHSDEGLTGMFSTLFLMNCILGNVIVTFNVFFNKPNTITKNKNNFINIPTFLSLYSLDFANEEADASEHSFPCPSVCSRSHLRLLSALVWGQSTDSRAKDSPVSIIPICFGCPHEAPQLQ